MSLGVYQDAIGEEVSYLLRYAGARIIIAEDEEQVDKLLDLINDVDAAWKATGGLEKTRVAGRPA